MFKLEAKNNAIRIWGTMKKAKQHNKPYTLNEFKNDMDLLIKRIELYNTDANYIQTKYIIALTFSCDIAKLIFAYVVETSWFDRFVRTRYIQNLMSWFLCTNICVADMFISNIHEIDGKEIKLNEVKIKGVLSRKTTIIDGIMCHDTFRSTRIIGSGSKQPPVEYTLYACDSPDPGLDIMYVVTVTGSIYQCYRSRMARTFLTYFEHLGKFIVYDPNMSGAC